MNGSGCAASTIRFCATSFCWVWKNLAALPQRTAGNPAICFCGMTSAPLPPCPFISSPIPTESTYSTGPGHRHGSKTASATIRSWSVQYPSRQPPAPGFAICQNSVLKKHGPSAFALWNSSPGSRSYPAGTCYFPGKLCLRICWSSGYIKGERLSFIGSITATRHSMIFSQSSAVVSGNRLSASAGEYRSKVYN